jgi:hypothetical protein
MFKLRKQAKQAKSQLPTRPSRSLQWRKSYNWVFLLPPLLLGGVITDTQDSIVWNLRVYG